MLMVMDRKEDFKGLAAYYPDFVFFHWRDFYDNPLRPSTDDDPSTWFPYFLELCSNYFDFRVASRNLMGKRLSLLYERSGYNKNRIHCPTPKDLYTDIDEQRFPLISNWARQRETVLDRLQGWLTIFGDNISSRRYADWERLSEIDFGISLMGLPTDYANFYISVLVAKLLYLRIKKGPRTPKLRNLIVVDECAPVFRRVTETRSEAGPPILADLLVQSREFGVGFLLATQSLVDLSYVAQANCARKVLVGGFGLGLDWEIFASSVGLDNEKKEFVKRSMKPGDAFASDPRYPYAFSLKVPYLPISKDVPVHLLKDRIKQFEALIFKEEPPIDSKTNATQESRDEAKECKSDSNTGGGAIKLTLDADRVLKRLSQEGCPFRFQSQIFESAGISSGTKQKRIKGELLGFGFIREHRLQRGKGFLIFWEITDKGWFYLNQKPPQYQGKGGWLHQAAAFFLMDWSKRNGFVCRLEAQIGPDKKAVDALLTKDTGEIWIVEFVFSEPLSKELSNLVSDLGSGLDISKLIFACRDGKLKQKLQSELESCPEFHKNRERVELSLAGDFCLTKGGGE
jgi:hypothetical protein